MTGNPDIFRISVCMDRFYSDERARCYVLVKAQQPVSWLQHRIQKLFALPSQVRLLSRGHWLPPTELLAILEPGDPVQVIPAFNERENDIEDDHVDSNITETNDSIKKRKKRHRAKEVEIEDQSITSSNKSLLLDNHEVSNTSFKKKHRHNEEETVKVTKQDLELRHNKKKYKKEDNNPADTAAEIVPPDGSISILNNQSSSTDKCINKYNHKLDVSKNNLLNCSESFNTDRYETERENSYNNVENLKQDKPEVTYTSPRKFYIHENEIETIKDSEQSNGKKHAKKKDQKSHHNIEMIYATSVKLPTDLVVNVQTLCENYDKNLKTHNHEVYKQSTLKIPSSPINCPEVDFKNKLYGDKNISVDNTSEALVPSTFPLEVYTRTKSYPSNKDSDQYSVDECDAETNTFPETKESDTTLLSGRDANHSVSYESNHNDDILVQSKHKALSVLNDFCKDYGVYGPEVQPVRKRRRRVRRRPRKNVTVDTSSSPSEPLSQNSSSQQIVQTPVTSSVPMTETTCEVTYNKLKDISATALTTLPTFLSNPPPVTISTSNSIHELSKPFTFLGAVIRTDTTPRAPRLVRPISATQHSQNGDTDINNKDTNGELETHDHILHSDNLSPSSQPVAEQNF